MTAHPFLTFDIRGKRDAIQVRYRARQVALLLQFPAAEQVCIAAGTFMVACQALRLLGRFTLCFAIERNQLHVYARSVSGAGETPACVIGPDSMPTTAARGTLFHMVKPLPAERLVAEADLAWLVHNGDDPSPGVFEEVIKQNQEVLALLHDLYTSRHKKAGEEPIRPSAA